MEAPTASYERSSLIRYTSSIDQVQATFNESVKHHSKNYSLRQLLVVFSYIYGNFFLAACVSIQAPFFPQEAESKGATPTQYGLVFGIYELAIVFTSPMVGKLVGRSTPKVWIQSGQLLAGLMTILFGFLDKVSGAHWFIGLAFFLRILEGIGAASFTTPSYSATVEEFPRDQATILSLLETSFGLGLICGPTLGGWLYLLGGYVLPFLLLGGLLIIGALLNFAVSYGCEARPSDPKEAQAEYLKILGSPGILLDSMCVITSLAFIGFNAATLEPHLRQFELSITNIGYVFIITGSIYALSTPIWGKLCKHVDTRLLCLVGCLFCTLGFLIIGPIPLLELDSSLWLVIGALVLIGIGTGVKLVAALVGSFNYAVRELAMPDNKSTFGVCSSIYHTSTSIGAFLGPSIGGYLLETVGYQKATYLLFASEFLLALLLVLFLVLRLFRPPPPPGAQHYNRLASDAAGQSAAAPGEQPEAP